jgi:hypothetical protein
MIWFNDGFILLWSDHNILHHSTKNDSDSEGFEINILASTFEFFAYCDVELFGIY